LDREGIENTALTYVGLRELMETIGFISVNTHPKRFSAPENESRDV
jgi:hypothetical protein